MTKNLGRAASRAFVASGAVVDAPQIWMVDFQPAEVVSGYLRTSGMGLRAGTLWQSWPSLRSATEALVAQIGVTLSQNGKPIYQIALEAAFEEFSRVQGVAASRPHVQANAFLHGLLQVAPLVVSQQVIAITGEDVIHWSPFSRPLPEWLLEIQPSGVYVLDVPGIGQHQFSAAKSYLASRIIEWQDLGHLASVLQGD